MSWILLLSVLLVWMCRSITPASRASYFGPVEGTTLFFFGLLLVVLFMGLWSRMLARRVCGDNLHRSLNRFHKSMFAARVAIPVWFGIAIFAMGWGSVVDRLLRVLNDWPVELPGMLLGTLPPLLAWMGLWWAQYPADRALREQSVLIQLDEDLPIHAPPGFWSYFIANLRLQILFTTVPVMLIMFLHDLINVIALKGFGRNLARSAAGSMDANIELVLYFVSIGVVVLFSPELLRRVLHTQPLPDSPLRQRLEAMCRRTGLKCRDILLWRTDNNMGNAAVMGLIPQVRYVLLSDVLLETMSDSQIEAVFAHEIGHVKHWHMGWYVVLIATIQLLCFGPGQVINDRLVKLQWLTQETLDAIGAITFIGGFFLVFGYLSRWFERQADVFAARLMEQQASGTVASAVGNPDDAAMIFDPEGWAQPKQRSTHVGPHGAATFASALHRVAMVNNIPVSARNFTHGSIAQRMEYLQNLSSDPSRTIQFDRWMSSLYIILLMGLVVCASWVMITVVS
ncbi:MAG TPA: M48 family metallopeptidase [Tepidisphaeraceae bacterium]|nr:M48 family metallopeptidase [Tepidisphaeraceae bacterium]